MEWESDKVAGGLSGLEGIDIGGRAAVTVLGITNRGRLARWGGSVAMLHYITLLKFNVHGASRTHGTEIKGSKHSPWNHHIKHHINLVRSAHCKDFTPRGCCSRVRCPAITL